MIKSVDCSNSKPKYPYLGIFTEGDSFPEHKDLIVLFTKRETGVALQTIGHSLSYPLGHYSCCWAEDKFVPCDKPITLMNV